MRVLIAGDWDANILRLGDATLHVGKDAMAVAQDAAYALLAAGVPTPVAFDLPAPGAAERPPITPELVEGPTFRWLDDLYVELAFALKMGPRLSPYRDRRRATSDLTVAGARVLYDSMWTRAIEWLRGERVPEDVLKALTVERPEPPLVAKARAEAEAAALVAEVPQSFTGGEGTSDPAVTLETSQAG